MSADQRGREKAEREFYRREQLRRKKGGRRKDKAVSVAPTSEEPCTKPTVAALNVLSARHKN
jgi:hypothetical protein